MNKKLWIAGVVLVGGVAALTTAVAEDEKKMSDKMSAEEMQAHMEAWIKLNQPSAHHRKLDPLVGAWDVKIKVYMGGPGSEPDVSEGTAEVKWILGKRFIEETFHGTMMGMPFEGRGVTGYDNFRNVYQVTWMDSMSTTILNATGVVDHETGKVFRYYGEMDEPSLKVVGRYYKLVTRVINADKRLVEMYDLHVGDDFKVWEMEYTRKK